MVNWTGELPELKHLCHLFLRIFDAYASNLRLSTAPSDMVLKVIPGTMIASSAYIALPTVPELICIAKDIYDSCPTQAVSISPYSSLSLVQLTPEVPDAVDFRLQLDNPVVLLQEQSVAHVAYCWDEGSSWLTATLTDTLGCHSWSASFYTGVSSNALATLSAIAKEVLDVAREALEEAHGCPRTIVTRDEPMHPTEAEGEFYYASTRLPLIKHSLDLACSGTRSFPGCRASRSEPAAHIDVEQLERHS